MPTQFSNNQARIPLSFLILKVKNDEKTETIRMPEIKFRL